MMNNNNEIERLQAIEQKWFIKYAEVTNQLSDEIVLLKYQATYAKEINDKLCDNNKLLREALQEIFLTDIVSFVHANYSGEYPVS